LIAAVNRNAIARETVERANGRLDRLFHDFVRPASRWNERSIALMNAPASA
jgi:hypothetical protein